MFATVYDALLIIEPSLVGNIGALPAGAEFLAHIKQSPSADAAGLGLLAWLFRDGDALPETSHCFAGLVVANVMLAVSLVLSQFTRRRWSWAGRAQSLILFGRWGLRRCVLATEHRVDVDHHAGSGGRSQRERCERARHRSAARGRDTGTIAQLQTIATPSR